MECILFDSTQCCPTQFVHKTNKCMVIVYCSFISLQVLWKIPFVCVRERGGSCYALKNCITFFFCSYLTSI